MSETARKIRTFGTPSDFGKWLERQHASAPELWVGFRKKGSGLPSLTWPESVDETLCWGWIDGIRKSVDDSAYASRLAALVEASAAGRPIAPFARAVRPS